jgi:hypothetical protein
MPPSRPRQPGSAASKPLQANRLLLLLPMVVLVLLLLHYG